MDGWLYDISCAPDGCCSSVQTRNLRYTEIRANLPTEKLIDSVETFSKDVRITEKERGNEARNTFHILRKMRTHSYLVVLVEENKVDRSHGRHLLALVIKLLFSPSLFFFLLLSTNFVAFLSLTCSRWTNEKKRGRWTIPKRGVFRRGLLYSQQWVFFYWGGGETDYFRERANSL